MATIFELFTELNSDRNSRHNINEVCSIPEVVSHKLGITQEGYPRVFICVTTPDLSLINRNDLEIIDIQYNVDCELFENSVVINKGKYILLTLRSNEDNIQRYFLDIILMLLKNIGDPSFTAIARNELSVLVRMFASYTQPAKKTIQGLWAELLLISESKSPSYLIECWHVLTTDKYDFNNGLDKLEVKSSSTPNRLHRFSSEQLVSNPNSNLVICSIIAIESGAGLSVIDLVNKISNLIGLDANRIKLNEIVANTLGEDLDKSFNIFYDYKLAVDSIAFFDSVNIPKIDVQNIPSGVSNVSYTSDLSKVIMVSDYSINTILSRVFKLL